jgi:hypothetical protein
MNTPANTHSNTADYKPAHQHCMNQLKPIATSVCSAVQISIYSSHPTASVVFANVDVFKTGFTIGESLSDKLLKFEELTLPPAEEYNTFDS